jgi:tRNA(His) guanylyltransferase
MIDSLGDRMKRQYENRTRYYLPRRTNTLMRVDGKAFHTYTQDRPKPWDPVMHCNLCFAAQMLVQESGAEFAFVQSDEISVLLTDYATITTAAWFDGNIQKLASVAASIVTAHFNESEGGEWRNGRIAYFDARVFSIPDPVEVYNYFVWRQKDIERNSLSMLAQAQFSHDQLHGQNRDALLAMLKAVGTHWEDSPQDFREGSVVTRDSITTAPIFTETDYIKDVLTAKVDA